MMSESEKLAEIKRSIDYYTDDIRLRQLIVQRGCTREEALENLARVTEDRKEIVKLREEMQKYK